MSHNTKNLGSLWQSSAKYRHNEIRDRFLTVDARQVIGILYSVSEPTLDLVIRVTMLPPKIAARMFKEIIESPNLAIKNALERGLSLDASVDLTPGGQRVRCKACNSLLSSVPCRGCIMGSRDRSAVDATEHRDGTENKILKECRKPTTARPGSYEKLLVMQKRLEKGYSAFHKDDEKIAIEPIHHNQKSIGSRRQRYINGNRNREFSSSF